MSAEEDVCAGLSLIFPFTSEQVQAVVVAADAFGVEPWDMAVHVLNFRAYARGERTMPRGRKCEWCRCVGYHSEVCEGFNVNDPARVREVSGG